MISRKAFQAMIALSEKAHSIGYVDGQTINQHRENMSIVMDAIVDCINAYPNSKMEVVGMLRCIEDKILRS